MTQLVIHSPQPDKIDGDVVKLTLHLDGDIRRDIAVGRYDAKNKVVIADVDMDSTDVQKYVQQLWQHQVGAHIQKG